MPAHDISKNQLTLVHLTVSDASPVELLKVAAESRFSSVAPRLVSPCAEDRITPVIGNEPLIRDLISLSNDLGVEIPYVDGIWIGPQSVAEDYELAFDVAARIGAKDFVVIGFDSDEERFIDNFGKFCELSSQFGLSLGIEFIPYSRIKNLSSACRIIKKSGMKNSKLVIDTLHLIRSGGSPQDLLAIDPGLISIFQISDAPYGPVKSDVDGLRQEARQSRLYPGHGALPLAEMVKILPAGLAIGVEVPHASHVALSVVDRARLAADTTLAFLSRVNNESIL